MPDVLQQHVVKLLVQRKDFRDWYSQSWSTAQAGEFESILYAEEPCGTLEFLKYFCFL